MSDQVTDLEPGEAPTPDATPALSGAPAEAEPSEAGETPALPGRGRLADRARSGWAAVRRALDRVRFHPHAQHPRTRRALVVLRRGTVLVLIAAAGGWIGATLAPSTTAYVGPLTAEV